MRNLNLSTLDGRNGFIINGIDVWDLSGASVNNAGDINNDGIDDVIIGAPGADPGGRDRAGESYVIFGGDNLGSTGSLNLSALNGRNGFFINGIYAREPRTGVDTASFSVSNAGDINNDGINDVIIGVRSANPGNIERAGESYVIFGTENVGSTGNFNLSTLNGRNGFVINGINPFDGSGRSISNAGDINNDGIDDVIIGAANANDEKGEIYIIFGTENVGGTGSFNLSALNGRNGFVINGIDVGDDSGRSVSNLGDINGDGIDDLIIGAPNAYPEDIETAGKSYVVFGSGNIGVAGSLNLSTLNGSNGFVINGINIGDRSGDSVSNAGDVNDDGIDDLIIGAYSSGALGKSYIVFGEQNIGVTGSLNLSTLDGRNGFVIDVGDSVSNVGDLNDDGIGDLIIGVPDADPGGRNGAGESYVILGRKGLGRTGSFNLSALNGRNGFVINGIDVGDDSGASVSNAGDVNDDGIDDLIIGAPAADPGARDSAGESYIVFGARNRVVPVISYFNGDNKADILWRSLGGLNSISFRDVAIASNITPLNDQSWKIEDAIDFNGDGKGDILWRNSATGENAIWTMDSANVNSYDLITSVDNKDWQIQAADDFNGDGKGDILWRNSITGQNAIWTMDGINVASYNFTAILDPNWQVEGTGDFNGDGKADIVWGNFDTGATRLWLMDGFSLLGTENLGGSAFSDIPPLEIPPFDLLPTI